MRLTSRRLCNFQAASLRKVDERGILGPSLPGVAKLLETRRIRIDDLDRAQLSAEPGRDPAGLGLAVPRTRSVRTSWCFPVRETIRPNRSGICSYGTFPDNLESDLEFDRKFIIGIPISSPSDFLQPQAESPNHELSQAISFPRLTFDTIRNPVNRKPSTCSVLPRDLAAVEVADEQVDAHPHTLLIGCTHPMYAPERGPRWPMLTPR